MHGLTTSLDRKHPSGGARRRVQSWALSCMVLGLIISALAPAVASAKAITKPKWLDGVRLTEYWPVPEAWFTGRLVVAPGLKGKHHVDWLFSARGLSMEGDGTALDGSHVHIDSIGAGGWIDANGRSTSGGGGAAVWRSENAWRNRKGAVTFPLDGGGWSQGIGKRFTPNKDITFAPGPSRPLKYYQSIAVDPSLIALGSRVYIPAYRAADAGGWMCAVDTGGAIIGKHIDVYRPAPKTADGDAYSLDNEKAYVLPAGRSLPAGGPRMSVDPCTGARR